MSLLSRQNILFTPYRGPGETQTSLGVIKTFLSQRTLTVSGKSNTSTVGGVDTTTISGLTSVAGNVQVGYYQWDDDHSADTSLNKGGNLQSGDLSMVQQNATVLANQMAWGGASQSVTTNNADIGANQELTSWWIMYLGGF